jgi:hypothetical protein
MTKHPARDVEIRELSIDDLAAVFHLGESLFTCKETARKLAAVLNADYRVFL